MPGEESPPRGQTRRSLLTSVCAIAFASPTSREADEVADLCRQWLDADAELVRLYTDWAGLDVSLMGAHGRRAGPGRSRREILDRMAELDLAIDAAIPRRENLLQRLQGASVRSVEGALGKLRVAVSRLEGEGGPEHRLVKDALLYLAD